ncbi:MAG: hypothetical protein JW894_15675 [Bacteroidales bacterium]|nr:hypothetical protein [Bacteroidales bacterium]
MVKQMIIKIRVTTLILFFLLINLCIKAQNFINVFNGRLYYIPVNSINNSDEDVSFSEHRLELALPYVFDNENIIGLKAQYKRFSLKSDDPLLKSIELNTLKIPLFAYFKWGSSKWSSYIDINPKLNSDFKYISGRHFQIGGMLLMFKERKENFFWQFGLIYNQDTYGPFVMPLFGLDWTISGKSYFAALLPAYLIFEQRVGKRIYTGIEVELSGETFRLGASEYENSFISQLGKNKLTFLTEPHLFLDVYVTKNVVIYLKPGMRLFHKYEHYSEDDELIEDSEYIQGELKNSFYTEFGLALRFRYDEPGM